MEHIKGLAGISTLDPPAMFFQADMTNSDQIEALFAEVDATYGRLDAVWANAGVAEMTPIGSEGVVDIFGKVMDLNVTAVFSTINVAVPMLKKTGGGSILMSSSVLGQVAAPWLSAYVASKHALEGMKKSFAQELAPFGIRVNNINPSFTASEMTGPYAQLPPFHEGIILQIQPDKRMCDMGKVSAAAAYLLSDDSVYVSAQSLAVDGGMLGQVMNPLDFLEAGGKAMAMIAAVTAAAAEVSKE